MRLLALCFTLAACAGPPSGGPGPVAPVPADGSALDADQRAALAGLGIPALVPGDAGAFRLRTFEADSDGRFASYRLGYRRDDGACFEVSGSNEGLGGPEWPLVSTEARVASLGRTVRVYQAADDPRGTSAQVWGVSTVVSEIVDLDGTGVLFLSDTQDGCRPVSLDEGAALVADLRLLAAGAPRVAEPVEPSAFGEFTPAPDLLEDYNAASTARAAADALATRYGDDADRVLVEVLGETDAEATVLVTALGLRDDSIRDERLLLTYRPYGPTWELVEAARQVRCWEGRGHQDWSPAACL